MSKSPGYICYSFQGYDIIDYSKTSSLTSTIGMGLGSYINMRYQLFIRDKIQRMYQNDALTGLYTRLAFYSKYEDLKEDPDNNGKDITIPTYDFHTGTAYFEDKNKMTLKDNEILIMEGIHGLNDKLTPKVASELKFKIYLSALTQLNLDDHNRISTSDNRLIRRIVRDNNFRGKPAAGTIEMWPSVRRGEELHIFPFQNNADAVLNTALDYELSVLRVYAAPLLRQVTPMEKEYAEERRLLQFLENFATISPSAVPPRSIIREFIGGSAFKY